MKNKHKNLIGSALSILILLFVCLACISTVQNSNLIMVNCITQIISLNRKRKVSENIWLRQDFLAVKTYPYNSINQAQFISFEWL